MSENTEQIKIELTLDTSQAHQEVDSLSDLAKQLPDTMDATKQNLSAVASDMKTILDFADPENGTFNRLPEQFRFSMEQMARIAKSYMTNINKTLATNLNAGNFFDDQLTANLDQRIGMLNSYAKNIISATRNMEQLSTNMSSNAMSVLNNTIIDMQRELLDTSAIMSSKNVLGAATDNSIARTFLSKKANKEGLIAAGKALGFDDKQQRLLLDALIQGQIPSYQRSDFFSTAARYANGALKQVSTIDKNVDYHDRLPDVFKDYFDNKKAVSAVSDDKYAEKLSAQEYRTVQKLAATNIAFRESLIAAGLGEYATKGRKAGMFIMPNEITRKELAAIEGFLLRDQLKPSLEGSPLYYSSLNDTSDNAQRRLASRQNRTVVESLNALDVLKDINLGVSPIAQTALDDIRVSIKENYDKKDSSQKLSVGSIQTIRPDQYVVMSLTPDDFKKGKIPEKSQYSSNILDLDKLDGKSGFKTLTRSNYTDLAGMFGHNTAGDGVRGGIDDFSDMFDAAKMLIVDYNQHLFKKDDLGNLVWRKDRSGLPEMNEDTIKEIEQLFVPNTTLTYGDNKEYQYHVETRTVNGKEMRYVPTNTKGGGVVFVNEDAYIKNAKRSLEEFGVNVFDNMASADQIYAFQNDANKTFEARNRLLTPSIPLNEIGGKLPDANKIAFVDMSKLIKDNDAEFGHDGSMFFMPGYIPGGAGTMRIGSAIKGVGQTVDYKSLIKHMYRLEDNEPFYLPGLNIPQELRKQFGEGGLEAIRKALPEKTRDTEYKNILDKYFVDVMKYEALIPDSVIKSPILKYKGTDVSQTLNNSEAQDVLSRYLDIVGGARMVQTAEGFRTHGKPFLSAQIAQSLELSDEQIQRAAEAASQHIYDLQNNVDAQLKYVFTDKNNVLDQQIHANPSIIKHSASAQERINEAVKSAQESLIRGDIFAQGLNFMELALANPGEWILKYGALNNKNVAKDARAQRLAEIMSLTNSIAGINLKGNEYVGAARYPNNQSEQFSFNVSNPYIHMLRQYKMNSAGVYMNSKDIAKMGGGDFDGDTIQLAFGWLQEAFAETENVRNEQLSPYRGRFSVDPEKLPMTGDKKLKAKQIAEAVYRQSAASIAMGSVSKAMNALAQGDWSDDLWVKTVGAGALDLKSIYDIDSVFAKTGVLREWSTYARNAKKMGISFPYLVKDLESSLENSDFSKMTKMSEVNIPSIFNHGVYAALTGLQNTPMSNDSLRKLIEAQMGLEGVSMADLVDDPVTPEQFKARYLYDNIRVMSQMLTGRASGGLSAADEDLLRSDLDAWKGSLGDHEYWSAEERVKYEPMDQEIKNQESRLHFAANYGLTQRNREAGRGYANLYTNTRYTGELSDFQKVVDSSNYEQTRMRDLRNLQVLGGIMSDPSMRNSLASAIKPYEIAAAKQKADDFRYSFSMLDKFMGFDTNEPNRAAWYRQYILGEKSPDNIHTAIGKAEHATMEAWANARISQQDYMKALRAGEAEGMQEPKLLDANDLVEIFNKNLAQYSRFFTFKDGAYEPNDPSSSLIKKMKDSYNVIRMLPDTFVNEDIEIAEGRIANFDGENPDKDYKINGERPYIKLGYKMGDNSQEVLSVGYIDLITRKRKEGEGIGQATGERVVVDAKGDQSLDRHKTQLAAYAGAVGADKIRVFSFRTGASVEQDVTPEMVEEANSALQEGVKEIQLMAALTGFNPKAMAAIPASMRLAQTMDTFNPSELIQKQKEREEAEKRSLFTLKREGHSTVIDKGGNVRSVGQEDRGDLTEEQFKALKLESLSIDPNSSKAFAKEMSLQTDMMDFSNELRKMQSDLLSKTVPKDPDNIRNPWVGYSRFINDNYRLRKEAYRARGASEFDLATLDAEQRQLQNNYDIALRSRASLDLIEMSEKLQQDLHSADGKTAVSKYSKEFEELTKQIQIATMAYNTLKERVESAEENGGKADADDVAALETARKEYIKMRDLRDERYKQIRAKSLESFNADAYAMFDIVDFGELSADSEIDKKVRELRLRKENNILQAGTDLESKIIDKQEYDRRVSMMNSIDVDKYEKRLWNDLHTRTNNKYESQLESLKKSASSHDYFAQIKLQADSFSDRIREIRESLALDFELGKINQEDYNQNIEDLDNLEEELSTAQLLIRDIQGTANRVAAQFARKIFHQAASEATRFVMEYDAMMTEIQTITMAADERMGEIGSSIIEQSIDLRTPVSNVASVTTELYRQGLPDEEVKERTSSIVKFAQVAKIKTEEATKIITTALQNNLVNSAEDAMDALVALGDNAATTASEIAKGMQRSAASAKVAGVSYEELTAMLTVGTSMTQLSGAQIGTAYKTIFSRMRSITSDKYAADASGEITSANEVEAALSTANISLRDEAGGFRDVFDILLDISKVWADLSDMQKSVITQSISGARQANIFQTLIEGMADDGGKTMEEYLGLASDSKGITQSKYEIAVSSISASIDTLKSSFDGLVATVESADVITGFLDNISSFLQSLSGHNGDASKMIALIGAIGGSIAAIAALASPLGAAGAAAIALGTSFVYGFTSAAVKSKEAAESLQLLSSISDSYAKDLSTIADKKNKIEQLDGKFQNLSESEKNAALSQEEYVTAIENALSGFDDLTTHIDTNSGSIRSWNDAVKTSIDRLTELDAKTRNRMLFNSQQIFEQKYEESAGQYNVSSDVLSLDKGSFVKIDTPSRWSREGRLIKDAFVNLITSHGQIEDMDKEDVYSLFGTDDVDRIMQDGLVEKFYEANGLNYAVKDKYNTVQANQKTPTTIFSYLTGSNGQTFTETGLRQILLDATDKDPGYKNESTIPIIKMFENYLTIGNQDYEKMRELGYAGSFNDPGDSMSIMAQFKNDTLSDDAFWFIADLYGKIAQATPTEEVQQMAKETAAEDAVSAIDNLDALLASENATDEEKSAIRSYIKQQIVDAAEEGLVDLGSTSSVSEYLYGSNGGTAGDGLLDEMARIRNYKGNVNSMLPDESFRYFINGTDGERFKFYNKEEVENFLHDNGELYSHNSVFTRDGLRAYTNSGDLIASGMKYRTEQNEYRPEIDAFIDKILAATQLSDIDSDYNQSIEKINANAPELAVLYELVNRTQNGKLNEGETGMTFEQFQNLAKYYKTGSSVDLGYVDAYASGMLGTSERAYDLMTNASLRPIYESSASVLGDPFTDYVEAVAAGKLTTNDTQAYRQARYEVIAEDYDLDEEATNAILSLKGVYGSVAEQMEAATTFSSMMSETDMATQAWAGIRDGNLSEANISTLSSYLKMDSEDVSAMLATEGGSEILAKRFDETKKVAMDVLCKAIEAMLAAREFELGNLELNDENLGTIFSTFVSDWIAMEIEKYNITASGGTVNIGDISGDKPNADTLMQNSYKSQESDVSNILTALIKSISSSERIENGQSVLNYARDTNANITDDVLLDFYSSNEHILNLLQAHSIGQISDNDLSYALKSELAYGSEYDSGYMDIGLKTLLGDEYSSGNVDMNNVLSQYEMMSSTEWGQDMLDDLSQLEYFSELLGVISDGYKDGTINQEDFYKGLGYVNSEMNVKKTSEILKYDRALDKVNDTARDLAAGGEDAAQAYSDLYESTRNLSNAGWALEQYKSGDRSSKVTEILSQQFGFKEQDLKKASKTQAKMYSDIMSTSYEDQLEILKTNFDTNFGNINDFLSDEFSTLPENFEIPTIGTTGKVDVSGLLKAFSEAGVIVDSAWVSMVKAMAEAGATFTVGADGNSLMLDYSNLKTGGGGYYGGGGGGSKKSSADKLVERLGHGQSLYEHQIKMVQYEQTKYENADELGNYAKMLEEEIKIERAYLPILEDNIRALEDELSEVSKGSEDWYKLRDAILEAEEQYSEINNTIQENENKLKENHQAILKLHTDLEEMVVGEIELRIDAEKDMLAGSVSMQDIILNAIKQRYQDEWDLIKQDIEKKKEALQQEKDLIDERLDARRDAEDEAAKYEELAELKKQLALVSMDSTRTKDAAALRESIAELEKEIGWDIAEREAENEKNAIQDQIDAYDDYITKGDEDLETLLEDANNFTEEINGVMKLNQTELFDWLKQNVKEYANSLDDAQKQMVQSWEDTYKQMLGITDTYWDEVNAILSSKDSFIEYMKQSKEYIYASDDERAQLLYQWEEAYDKWIKAQKNDADYDHSDNGLGDWSGSEYTGSSSSSGSGGGGGSNKVEETPTTGGTVSPSTSSKYGIYDDDGKHYGWATTLSDAMSVARSVAKNTRGNAYITDAYGKTLSTCSYDGSFKNSATSSNSSSSNSSLPPTGWPATVPNQKSGYWYYKITENGLNVAISETGYSTRQKAQDAAAKAIKSGQKYSTKQYVEGGIADFTGLAWLDGTKERPERILSAQQTASFDELVSIMDDLRSSGITTDIIKDMMKWSTTINVPSQLSYVGNEAYRGNIANIGDIHVTVQEAQINDDRDIDELANVVGQKFVKEISKQGFNIAHYNF